MNETHEPTAGHLPHNSTAAQRKEAPGSLRQVPPRHRLAATVATVNGRVYNIMANGQWTRRQDLEAPYAETQRQTA